MYLRNEVHENNIFVKMITVCYQNFFTQLKAKVFSSSYFFLLYNIKNFFYFPGQIRLFLMLSHILQINNQYWGIYWGILMCKQTCQNV